VTAPETTADLRADDKASDAEPVILVTNLVSAFDDNVIHDGLSLEVRKGEIIGLVGGSGAGKSVLLNTLIGLRTPQGGSVEVLGVNVYTSSDDDRDALERRWGVLFQSGALFSSLTVRENVAAPMHEHTRLSAHTMDELADSKLVMVGLEPRAGNLHPAEDAQARRPGPRHRARSRAVVSG
jgi:phospholipid/cholesterol/gamma-HCH transport system ATP-binding protein